MADPLTALKEIARLRLATDEGSLRVRADRMWDLATKTLADAVRGAERPSFAKLKEAVEFWEYRGVDGKGQRTGAYSWPMDFGSCERIAELALKYIVDLRADPPSLTPPADQETT